ncbi:polysaccharide biosynthesis C-terminal domain-containing protein [Flavihumibacter rivuli]|uniref:lipopolysaccharide biosynthesis protein n=1 Tax=Flavihumibacter rivuli TaxID=2838156 RepID=UPI001BDF06B7|nr:MATE family efflux transporter [Flavihumibacter rivuli]ULQ57423.1 polysaccharide biosynthesis C-terminal domain-containing protein [Flavihumibacter rivuli]
MGQIRKQTILSSIVIYIGFAIGFLNTYLFVRNGTFSTEQYGLTRLMNDMGQTFFSFASFGVLSYIYKFFPYYKDNLKAKENDQVAISLLICTIGFSLVTIASILFQPLIIRKFSARSAMLVQYYYWILPYALGVLTFTLFEAFAWFNNSNILSNFLKETGLRLVQTVLILLFVFKLVDFDTFIKLFSFSYLVISLVLIVHLKNKGVLHFNLQISKVTRRFKGKIFSLMSLIYASLIINTLAQYVDSIIIASVSKKGLSDVGIYTLATFIANTIQVPQRSIISATVPILSASWKQKNYDEIKRVYYRSSINLFLIAMLIFGIIWLNIDEFFGILNINKDFEAGKNVILILGISKVIDAGTGVNSQIIGTSNLWKFEVISGSVLLFLFIPLNYLLVKEYGIDGSAISNLVSFGIYNGIRYGFIWYKFGMQPFTIKTALSSVVMVAIYFGCSFAFGQMQGITGIIFRSFCFVSLAITFIFFLDLTPDAKQLLTVGKEKLESLFERK